MKKRTETPIDKKQGVGEGAIRKRTQEKIDTKPKIEEGKDAKEKEEQRNMTEERKKTGNTFSVLQEED